MAMIGADNHAVTQITFIEPGDGRQAEALELMAQRATYMARQPGCISISLHRSLDGRRIVNYVQWESAELLRSAHHSPQFRKEWARFDRLTDQIDPHLYEVTHALTGESAGEAPAQILADSMVVPRSFEKQRRN